MVVDVHHLRVAVSAGFLFIRSRTNRVSDASPLQIVKSKPLFGCDDVVRGRKGDESLPGGSVR